MRNISSFIVCVGSEPVFLEIWLMRERKKKAVSEPEENCLYPSVEYYLAMKRNDLLIMLQYGWTLATC